MVKEVSDQSHLPSSGEIQSIQAGTDPENSTEGEAPGDLDLDTVFDALRNQRRRHLLRYLHEASGPVTLSDVTEHVAALENDTTPEALDSQQRKRVYVALYQAHLPKLYEMGILTFN
jgi:hypothetical protein